MNDVHRPLFLYRVFQIFAFVGALPVVINTVDVLLTTNATPLNGSIASRLATGLIIAPLTLVIAILCVRRAPHNLIGWMLIAFSYGSSWLAMRRDLLPLVPTLMIAGLFNGFFWFSYVLIPLYFPNGYLYPPRFARLGNRLIGLYLILSFILANLFNRELSFGAGENAVSAPNPLFIGEFNFTIITIPVTLGLLILGAASLVLRYRRGSSLERLQLRWLLTGVIAQFGLIFLSTGLASALKIDITLVGSVYTVIIPICIGVAVLRNNLYDIDIIIRRTLIYSILTAALAMLYFGGVVLAQVVLKPLTASSDLAIILSTLAIAALVNPLRHRIQNTIDRRFFRRKYDAQKTLEAFSLAVRDEVDLDKLQAALVGVVQDTMQPTKVALWVRESASSVLSEGETR